jgi:hypothetical protein
MNRSRSRDAATLVLVGALCFAGLRDAIAPVPHPSPMRRSGADYGPDPGDEPPPRSILPAPRRHGAGPAAQPSGEPGVGGKTQAQRRPERGQRRAKPGSRA